MRKFKSPFILIIASMLSVLVLLFLVHMKQSREKATSNKDFNIGVIETTEQDNKSNLTFYNKDLKKTGTQKIKLGSMGSSFDLPRMYGKNMYVVPKGIGNQKELTVIMEYNTETSKYKTYDMKQHGINSFAVNDKAIYSANTLSNESIISWYDKRSGNLKTISKEGIYIDRIDLYNGTLYAFAMEKDNDGNKSHLYLIDTKSFKITDIIDISKSGEGHNYSTKIGDDIYFTNQYEVSDTERGSYNLSKFNIKNKTVSNIKLKERYPFQILNYKNKLIISHYDLVQMQGNKITIYDPGTNEQDVVTLENNLGQISIKDDKLYSKDGEYLYVYSINNKTFKLINNVDIYTKRKNILFYYVSGFFTK
ncbi:hypothetical protein KPL35_15215 [Clostridium sp. CF011]|uniref:hypothetical protein n=1 Tax=Clostridium sp. CF011 TaxID=2843318 RepID=UPI001C0CE8C2|nr:hypothetical protein [Clostridium sp. CF011]MBU3093413.1 hypothetical protein [Clostridium sp. CF011]WAG71260.1 hypothetical protein LL036_07595 [Clostridium sp. CF011]